MRQLLLATSNQGKISEIVAGLSGMPFTVVSLNDVKKPPFEVEETATSFEGNALIKAFIYGKHAGILTMAEDSGLEVDALGGRPGVQTARYGVDDADRRRKLLAELSGIPEGERGAHFRTVIAIYDPERNDKIRVCEGVSHGHIAMEERGGNGFGYDPIFHYDHHAMTGGEMSVAEKMRVSHRGRSLVAAREVLTKEFV